jgi:acyl-CoA thioesterase FadM
LQPHISTHRVWPWDLDVWFELNNGRTLTLFDLGRIPMAKRMGFDTVARARGWGLTVAGNSTRYRKRVTAFQRLTQVSRVVGWDARFVYLEQSFWRGDECTTHMLLRNAFISKAGMVPPAEVLAALGQSQPSPPLPEWISDWIAAEAKRPWPPQR